MTRIFIGFFIFFISVTCNAQLKKADVTDIENRYLDIPYATLSNAQKLDIYLPDEGDGPFPVILSIHGGGFMAGDKRDTQVTPMLRGLKRGYAVVSINYRLSGEAKWPAQIFDCKAAVRWIRKNAGKYNLKTDKIVAWGASAGGHLSAMLGTSGDVMELEGLELGNSNQSSRIQAVVNWFGPIDFLKMDEQLKESGVNNPMHHLTPDSPESLLLGKNLQDVPYLVKEANPVTYISPGDPPFFIQHGIEDNLVPYQGSVTLARELEEVIGFENVYLELFPATGHGNSPAFYTEENFNKIFAFIEKSLDAEIQFKTFGNKNGRKGDLPDSGFIEIDGAKLKYVVEGDGIPCLVVGSSVYYPKTFSKDLRRSLKMYFVDMRWFAPERGDIAIDNFSINTIIDDIEKIRLALDLEKPILLGHSIHGTIAMEYAKKHPQNISSLILICSPNIFGNEEYNKATTEAWNTASEKRKELQKKNWEWLYKNKDKFSETELFVEEYCAMSPKYSFDPTYDFRWLWKDTIMHLDLIHYLYGTIFNNYTMFSNIESVSVPTLVLLGKYDFAIPPNLWEKDSNVTNIDIHIFEKSGHTPQLEESNKFNTKVIEWLSLE